MITEETLAEMRAFALPRRGWHLAAAAHGFPPYAWRLIYIYDSTHHLRVYPSALKDDVWCANVISDSTEQIAAYVGTFAEVTAEIVRTEKTLDLVEQLRACRTATAARGLIGSVRGGQLEVLRRALQIPRGNADKTRSRIMEMTCGLETPESFGHEPPLALVEFGDGRGGWRVYQEKLSCWVASRRLQIFDAAILLLVTPNWREKESLQDWTAEVIVSSDGNVRLADYRDTAAGVLASIKRAERTLDLVGELTKVRTYEAARALVDPLNKRDLDLLRRSLRLPSGNVETTRRRIVRDACRLSIKEDIRHHDKIYG